CPCPCACPYSCPLSLSLPFLPHNELEGARLRDAGARHEPRATRAALLDPERPPPPTPPQSRLQRNGFFKSFRVGLGATTRGLGLATRVSMARASTARGSTARASTTGAW